MAVLMLMEVPGGTQELYDAFNREMDMRPETLPDGLIAHYAGPSESGWQVVDVWESQDAFDRFAQERLMPAGQRVMGDEAAQMQPRFVALANEFHGSARV
jgi:hypothetical protein